MLILARVCAEFHDASGRKLFSIIPPMLLTFQEAPDAIQQDPLFQLLVDDGSMEAVVSLDRRRELEQDPIQGADPSGKRKATPPTASAESSEPETEKALHESVPIPQEKPSGKKSGAQRSAASSRTNSPDPAGKPTAAEETSSMEAAAK